MTSNDAPYINVLTMVYNTVRMMVLVDVMCNGYLEIVVPHIRPQSL